MVVLNQRFHCIYKKTATVFLFFGLVISLPGFAQKGNAEQKAAMQKLRWMAGSWKGQSMVVAENANRVTSINETVQPSLDGTILQITARASDRDVSTQRQSLAYTSFSVISYDVTNKKYRWTSWRTNGRDYEEQPFTIGTHSFEYISQEDGRQVRYSGKLGAKGEFLETGEYSANSSSWTSFITMKLTRRK